MVALTVSLGLFAAGWLLHVAWWRVRLPRHHSLALVIVFVSLPPAAAVAWLLGGAWPSISLAEVPAVLSLYIGAAVCYLITYSGVEQTSPTLVLVRALEQAGSKGCSREDLVGLITEDMFVRPRLEALRIDGLLTSAGRGFVLTARGRRAVRTSLAFTRLFNIRQGA